VLQKRTLSSSVFRNHRATSRQLAPAVIGIKRAVARGGGASTGRNPRRGGAPARGGEARCFPARLCAGPWPPSGAHLTDTCPPSEPTARARPPPSSMLGAMGGRREVGSAPGPRGAATRGLGSELHTAPEQAISSTSSGRWADGGDDNVRARPRRSGPGEGEGGRRRPDLRRGGAGLGAERGSRGGARRSRHPPGGARKPGRSAEEANPAGAERGGRGGARRTGRAAPGRSAEQRRAQGEGVREAGVWEGDGGARSG
jgi:hypothetical protein